jgi:hypothetical protein
MSILLLGSSAASKENVLRIVPITNQLADPEAELMTLFYKSIRIYSVTDTKLVFELPISEVIGDGLSRLIGITPTRDLKYNLLDAIVYEQGILMVLSVNMPPNEKLDFYLAYVSDQSAKTRRRVEYMFKIDVPDHLSIMSPFHNDNLPRVTLHVPENNECAVVFPQFVLLISKISNSNRNVIREEFDDFLLGVGKYRLKYNPKNQIFSATRNSLCHLILKDMGICALRRLPRLFDLSFWKKYRSHLLKRSEDFLGRDFEHLQQAFFSFCAKDLDKAALQSEKFAAYNELVFSNVVVQFLNRFLNGMPANDTRWTSSSDSYGELYLEYAKKKFLGQADKKAIIISQLREKLSFYRMFFLYLCSFNLMKKVRLSFTIKIHIF